MTRFLPLLIATSLIATQSFAGQFAFDMPDLTFPQPPAPITQSTAGDASGD